MKRVDAIRAVLRYVAQIDGEWGPDHRDPQGRREASVVLRALGVTDEELGPALAELDAEKAEVERWLEG